MSHWFSTPWGDGALLGGILALALAFRLAGIMREHPWLDEVMTLFHLHEASFGEFVAGVRRTEGTASFAYLPLAWGAVRLIPGGHVLVLRGVSIALGLASLAGVYVLGYRAAGRHAAVTATLFLAVSQTHVHYSQEIRPYALLMAAAALSSIAFLNAYARPTPSKRWIALNTAANAVVVWAHMLAPLLLAAQGLTLWGLMMRRYKRWIAWGLLQMPAVILLAVLWIRTLDWELVGDVTGHVGLPGIADLRGYFHVLLGTLFHHTPDLTVFMRTGKTLELGILALGGIGLLGSAWAFVRPMRAPRAAPSMWEPRFAILYLSLWSLVPAGALFLFSYVWMPIFVVHYVIHAIMPLALLVTIGLGQLPGRWLRGGLAALLILAAAHEHLAFAGPARPNYADAFQPIVEADAGEETIVVYPPHYELTVAYNWRRLHGGRPEPRLETVEDLEVAPDLLAERSAKGRAWLLVHGRWTVPSELEERLRAADLVIERYPIPGGVRRLFVYEAAASDRNGHECVVEGRSEQP